MFQERVLHELRNVKESIEKERSARAQADDDIVVALKQYTLALHNALASNDGNRMLEL